MPGLSETTDYKNIVARFNTLTAESQAKWGKMNVAQMMAHCSNALESALGDTAIHSNFLLRLIGPLFKRILYGPKPFRKELPTAKGFIVTQSCDFDSEKNRLMKLLQRFYEDQGGHIGSKKHPLFGKLTKEQWSMGTYKHLDHHLQQFSA